MTHYICVTCGVQHAETDAPPAHCPICEDERQYIGHAGQRWTTIQEMQTTHHNRIEAVAPNLTGIGTVPSFAIGPRALLVCTPGGNVLWDCVSLLDDATVAASSRLLQSQSTLPPGVQTRSARGPIAKAGTVPMPVRLGATASMRLRCVVCISSIIVQR